MAQHRQSHVWEWNKEQNPSMENEEALVVYMRAIDGDIHRNDYWDVFLRTIQETKKLISENEVTMKRIVLVFRNNTECDEYIEKFDTLLDDTHIVQFSVGHGNSFSELISSPNRHMLCTSDTTPEWM